MEVRIDEELAQPHVVGHLAGGREDRHHHCRKHQLLVLPMPSFWMVESGRRDGEVLV
jgi:hypothetical protein